MSKVKRIVFFNGHQNGDLANSRGVVSYIKNHLDDLVSRNIIDPIEYYYFLLRTEFGPKGGIKFDDSIKIHNPIVEGRLDFMPPNMNVDIKRAHEKEMGPYTTFIHNDTLFFNLWVGCSPYFLSIKNPDRLFSQQALQYQTMECIDYIREHMGIDIPYPTSLEVLPSRTTSPDQKGAADKLIQNLSSYKKKVLICNNPTFSSQVPHSLNIGNIFYSFVDEYPDTAFLFIHKNFIPGPTTTNCFFTENYFSLPDLSEIDYISKEFDVILTQMSGAGIIVSNRDNYLDPNKTIISLTSTPKIAFEGFQTQEQYESKEWGLPEGAKLIWTNQYETDNIHNKIKPYIL